MNQKAGFTLVLILIFWIPGRVSAQLSITDTLDNISLIESLFGGGVAVSNLTATFCDSIQTGQFTSNGTNLGLNTGMIISTGNIASAPGPNTLGSTSTAVNPAQVIYPPLQTIAGQNIYDACVIEFDIIPYCDTIAISYVFASDEYPEFVNSINDAFAMFISGPGITTTLPGQNIALVPGTTTPVSINTVNPGLNSAFYVNNVGGTTIEYDGFTVPLLASATVQACEVYHITIAIGDASDGVWDSAVFLEAGGIGCVSPVVTIEALNSTALGNNTAVEGCVDGEFTFSLPAPLLDTAVFRFAIGGTATPGIDYQTLPDSVVIPAGQTTATLPVTIFSDALAEGVEFIQIIYTDSALCANQIFADTAFMLILDEPSYYDAPDVFLCSGDTIPIGTPSIQGQTYAWDINTGLSNDTISNPTLTLTNNTTAPFVQQYVLQTTALMGFCENLDTITVTVYPANNADFVADTVCFGQPMPFTDLTVADSLISWDWSFGDLSTSNVQNPTHTYLSPGTYTVTLATVNASGCPDTISQDVLVDSLAIMDMSVDPVCPGSPSQFLHTVGPGVSYDWRFGDGNTSSISLPSHLYNQPGIYDVTIITETAEGCRDTLVLQAEQWEAPTVEFTALDDCFGDSIYFNNLTQPGSNTTLNWQWDFGNGTGTSGQSDPVVLYPNHGVFPVQLIATDGNLCRDTATKPVEVFPPVTADFLAPNICAGVPVVFTDQSQAFPDGPIQGWQWYFGDGASDTAQNPAHDYSTIGTYPVQLIVTSIHGCTDSVVKNISVFDQPQAGFSYPLLCEGSQVLFNNTSTFQNPRVDYLWDFGGLATSTQFNPAFEFPGSGGYVVSLSVSNDDGCTDTFTDTVRVAAAPEVDFVADQLCAGQPVVFNNLTTVNDTQQVAYIWTFGDGSSSTEDNPTHTYPFAGVFNVSLVATGTDGCAGQTVEEIVVHPRPGAEFDLEEACLGDTVRFRDRSAIANISGDQIEQWNWQFGDGGTSTNQNPVHQYGFTARNLIVQLIVVSNQGCQDTVTRPIDVYQNPEVPETQGDTVCPGNRGLLLAGGIPPAIAVNWFLPGSANPFHQGFSYQTDATDQPLTYQVSAISEQGCESPRVPVTLSIFNTSQGAINQSADEVEVPNATVNFTIIGLAGQAWNWDFGDGNTAQEEAPTHTYRAGGLYPVEVFILDENGCETLLQSEVEVKEIITIFAPTAFTPNNDGANDEWLVEHQLIESWQVRVYDRWGVEVFSTEDLDFRWNGTDQRTGQALPEGVYLFTIEATDINGREKLERGSLTILR